jgi:hypothetical protein
LAKRFTASSATGWARRNKRKLTEPLSNAIKYPFQKKRAEHSASPRRSVAKFTGAAKLKFGNFRKTPPSSVEFFFLKFGFVSDFDIRASDFHRKNDVATRQKTRKMTP